MRIAIIGGGLSGLALCWHLVKFPNCQVTVFEKKGIGAGASGVSTGLLHPYAGEQVRRSWRAEEGINATCALLKVAEDELKKKIILSKGVIRILEDKEQQEQFARHFFSYGDVEKLDESRFLVASGMTIDVPKYLKGLAQASISKGAKFVIQEIKDLSELEEFDVIIVAAGSSSFAFEGCSVPKADLTKGQVLTYRLPDGVPFSHSLVAKGYISLSDQPDVFHLGSTYERDFHTEDPCVEKAVRELTPKLSFFFPELKHYSLLDCRAGIRVGRRGHYHPFADRMNQKCWLLSGLGSRGLLYHAYAAQNLVEAICADNESLIYKELRIS
jgi:glycine/D-amino acid oxidase-like deaminating enzyme